jgi:hypothetical protein
MENISHWQIPICSLDKKALERIKMRTMKNEIKK